MREKLHKLIEEADWLVYDEDDAEVVKMLEDLANNKDEEDDLDS